MDQVLGLFLDLSLWCCKEIPWPSARRQEGEKLPWDPSVHSSFLPLFAPAVLHSCLSQTLRPQEAQPSNIWGHFASLGASLFVFCLEMKWACPGPPGRRRGALQGVCPLSSQRGNKSSFRCTAVPKSMCSLLSLQHLWVTPS